MYREESRGWWGTPTQDTRQEQEEDELHRSGVVVEGPVAHENQREEERRAEKVEGTNEEEKRDCHSTTS